MVPQILVDLEAEVSRATTVAASAATLIRGFAARIQAAVDKALENAMTTEQLAEMLQDELDAVKASTDDLASAVSENTHEEPA